MLKTFCSFSLSLAVVGLLASATSAQLKAVGPLDPFGFPESYTDFNDITLVHGTDATDPLLLAFGEPIPMPNDPLDVATGNFYDETFYWVGEADMDTGAGGALLVLAIEGIWQNEVVVDGDQAVMGRLRIRVDLDTPGHFVVTHPYGVDEFDVTAAEVGNRAINFTADSIDAGVTPATAFTTPLDAALTRIGPTLLSWDSGAPAGYMGDPNIAHTVTGSPFNTNFFKVEGPNVGGPGIDEITTDLFAVAGKMGDPPAVTGWVDLGGGLAGTGGATPALTGTGDLTPNSQFSVDMTGAPPLSLGILFVGSQAGNMPFAGGILVPDPATGFRRQRLTNSAGGISFGGTFPSPPTGTQFYIQYFIQDAGGPQNFAGSNAIVGTVP